MNKEENDDSFFFLYNFFNKNVKFQGNFKFLEIRYFKWRNYVNYIIITYTSSILFQKSLVNYIFTILTIFHCFLQKIENIRVYCAF